MVLKGNFHIKLSTFFQRVVFCYRKIYSVRLTSAMITLYKRYFLSSSILCVLNFKWFSSIRLKKVLIINIGVYSFKRIGTSCPQSELSGNQQHVALYNMHIIVFIITCWRVQIKSILFECVVECRFFKIQFLNPFFVWFFPIPDLIFLALMFVKQEIKFVWPN